MTDTDLAGYRPAGYQANLKGRIPDIRPDYQLNFDIKALKAVMDARRHFLIFCELIWLSLQFGRISGYFQYPVSGRISGKSRNPHGGFSFSSQRTLQLKFQCVKFAGKQI
jgi:hypothetical protein